MGGCVEDRRRTGLYDGVQAIRVDPEGRDEGRVEADSSVGEEALADHPAEWDAREIVAAVVADGAAADVCGGKRLVERERCDEEQVK